MARETLFCWCHQSARGNVARSDEEPAHWCKFCKEHCPIRQLVLDRAWKWPFGQE